MRRISSRGVMCDSHWPLKRQRWQAPTPIYSEDLHMSGFLAQRHDRLGSLIASPLVPPALLAIRRPRRLRAINRGGLAMSVITAKDGTQIYYKDWGQGPIVTFSHGWPLSSDAWDGQMHFLA